MGRMRIRLPACVALAAALLATLCGCDSGIKLPASVLSTPKPAQSAAAPVEATTPQPPFVQENFAPVNIRHFVSSEPPNNTLLDKPPALIKLNFKCDLGSGSFISVKHEGLEMISGPMISARDNRSLSAAFSQSAPTGNYKVKYTIYWCDGSYFDGSFGFSILRKD